MEIFSYILTRDFNEFAKVREELLLRIMNFVEDSGTILASPSQTLYLSGDPGAGADKIKAAAKNASSPQSSTDGAQSESEARKPKADEDTSRKRN